MNIVKAAGAVVYTIVNNNIYYVIVENKKNICGFPKGMIEDEETEKVAALREIMEETSLQVQLMDDFKETLTYYQPEYDRVKYVTYFIGYYHNQIIKFPKCELNGCYLLSYDEAKEKIKETNTLELLANVNELIKKKGK